MKKLWETVKNNSEITGYVILAVLIFCACFSPYFIWVASIYALVFAIYMRNEIKIIGLILFVYYPLTVLRFGCLVCYDSTRCNDCE